MGQRGDAPARSVPKSVPASGDTVSGATWSKKAATYGCITPKRRLTCDRYYMYFLTLCLLFHGVGFSAQRQVRIFRLIL